MKSEQVLDSIAEGQAKREIKFRAWSKETEKMMDWDFIHSVRNLHKLLLLNHVVVMQYTGLKDNAGNDIYEDDFFESIYKDCPDGYSIMGKETTVIRIPAKVVFKFGKFMVEMMHPTEKELVYSDLFKFLKNTEKVVIGNTHQHSKLYLRVGAIESKTSAHTSL